MYIRICIDVCTCIRCYTILRYPNIQLVVRLVHYVAFVVPLCVSAVFRTSAICDVHEPCRVSFVGPSEAVYDELMQHPSSETRLLWIDR